jgi:hypothetical protein
LQEVKRPTPAVATDTITKGELHVLGNLLCGSHSRADIALHRFSRAKQFGMAGVGACRFGHTGSYFPLAIIGIFSPSQYQLLQENSSRVPRMAGV